MFYFSKPDRTVIEEFIVGLGASELTYRERGFTARGEGPPAYTVDHNKIPLGNGDESWEAAKSAIRNWKMFDFEWVELCWPETPIQTGRDVAILIYHYGFWSLNGSRIVYTIDETDRFGFAYGTLAEHGEVGEERFLVERDRVTGEVFYDLFAFSRPGHLLAKVGYPIARALQKQFGADSKAAMSAAVKTGF